MNHTLSVFTMKPAFIAVFLAASLVGATPKEQLRRAQDELNSLKQQLAQLPPPSPQQKKSKTWPAIPLDARPLTVTPLPKRDKLNVDRRVMLNFVVPDARELPGAGAGVVVDNTEAELVGQWQHSVHTPPFVGTGYIHDQKKGKGEKSVTYRPKLPKDGMYEVRMSHNANSSRSTRVSVTIRHADGASTVHVNQRNHPPLGLLFRPLGRFRFRAGQHASVTIANSKNDNGYVIADSMWFAPVANNERPPKKMDKQPRLTSAEIRKQDSLLDRYFQTKRRIRILEAVLAKQTADGK